MAEYEWSAYKPDDKNILIFYCSHSLHFSHSQQVGTTVAPSIDISGC